MDEPQTIKTPRGEELVVLSREDYDALIAARDEAEEELADIAALDQRLAEAGAGGEQPMPAAVSALLLQGNRRIAALRLWRGLDRGQLGNKIGISEQTIQRLEAGDEPVDADLAGKLAHALDVPRGWVDA